ncbi:MAG: SRPBCC family protein [Rickettsiales bacterium]
MIGSKKKQTGTVSAVHRYDASSEQVFEAWINPDSARHWLFATDTGTMVRAETDPRVGGAFTFTERRGAEDVEHTGEYLQIDPPYRLIFTFCVPKYSKEKTRVAVAIVPRDNGCELTLTHEGVPPDYAQRTHEGWMKILSNLDKTLRKV